MTPTNDTGIVLEKPVSEWLREHLLGGRQISYEYARASAEFKLAPSLDAVRIGPWSNEFHERRLARLRFGTWRYEPLGWDPKAYDVIGSAIRRLKAYETGGNQEHLVDAVNLIGLEWLRPRHQNSRWRGYCPQCLTSNVLDARLSLECYRELGYRGMLAGAVDSIEAEFTDPQHNNAHWSDTHRGDADDVGGVPQL